MSRTDVRADSFGADPFGADSFRDDMTVDELAHAMLGQLQAGTIAPDRAVNGRSPTRSPGAPDVRNALPPVGINPGLDPYTAFRSTATQAGGSDYYFLEFARAAAAATHGSGAFFDVDAVRRDFPILHKPVDGKPLVWLDNGATTQKPQVVIDTVRHFYENDNSNVHRAAHQLAARATELYEQARKTVQLFIGAGSPDEIIFTKGTTESINLAANSLGALLLKPGDEILLSTLEHHANIVPWQMIAARTGAKITTIPIDETGQVMLDEYYKLLGRRTKIVAISHVSNVLGTVLPVEMMTGPAHAAGAKVLVDGAQSIAHAPVNVTSMDADLFVFSGHKIYGPTGVGVLYGKRALLEQMPPWQGGGNMIENVSFEQTTYKQPPAKFEAGTPVLAGAIGLGAALRYLQKTGLDGVFAYEEELLREGMRLLSEVPGLRILGTAPAKVAVLSFSIAGVSPEEIGSALTNAGIAVRAGHHCAQPVLKRYGLTSIARASLGMYNTSEEIRKLASVLHNLRH